MALRETPALQKRRARARRGGQDKAAILDSLLNDIEREELEAQTGKKTLQGRLGLARSGRETGISLAGKRLGLRRERFETERDIKKSRLSRSFDLGSQELDLQGDLTMANLGTTSAIRGSNLDFAKNQADAARPYDILNIAAGGLGGYAQMVADKKKTKLIEDMAYQIRYGTAPGYGEER